MSYEDNQTLSEVLMGKTVDIKGIFFASDGMSFIEIINQDIVSSEILKALIGGIGIVLTIPITVLINTKLVNLKKT